MVASLLYCPVSLSVGKFTFVEMTKLSRPNSFSISPIMASLRPFWYDSAESKCLMPDLKISLTRAGLSNGNPPLLMIGTLIPVLPRFLKIGSFVSKLAERVFALVLTEIKPPAIAADDSLRNSRLFMVVF